MTIQSASADLAFVGLNTAAPKVFWKGSQVPDVVSIKINHDEGDWDIKLRVNGTADALYMELVTAGINVKKVK